MQPTRLPWLEGLLVGTDAASPMAETGAPANDADAGAALDPLGVVLARTVAARTHADRCGAARARRRSNRTTVDRRAPQAHARTHDSVLLTTPRLHLRNLTRLVLAPVVIAVAACQLLLPDGVAADGSPTDAGADTTVNALDGRTDADGGPSAPPCGLVARVFSFELQGSPTLLVSDGDGAYFTEVLPDGGKTISSMAAIRGGGLELRSIVTTPGDTVPLLWPDKKKPGFLRYLADGPSAHVFKFVAKSLQVLDPAYSPAPGPIYRHGPTDDRLILVLPGGAAGGVTIAAAAPASPYGSVPIATVDTLEPSSVLGVTCDEVAAYGATATGILQFLNGATTTLHDAPDGSAGPRGPIAVNRGVVYWLAGTDVFSVRIDAGAAVQLGTNMNAQALAVDDACVYFVTGDNAIVAMAHGGGGADLTRSEARNVTGLSASELGVFWTTAGVYPRAYAMLRPLPK